MMGPLGVFERVFVINLPSRADRRQEMEEQFRKIGLGWDTANIELFPAIRPVHAGEFPTVGTRGCFLSHLGVLKKAAAERLHSILILEDDVNFVTDFVPRMSAVERELGRRDWGFFYGGYKLDRPLVDGAGGIVEIAPSDGVQTAHFLGLNGDVLQRLINYLEAQLRRPAGHADGGPMHVDGSYTWFRCAHKEVKTVLAVPELAYQRASRTDIHDLRWHDRAPGVREAVALIRRLRN